MYIIQLSALFRIVHVNTLFQSSPIPLVVHFHNRNYVTQGFDLSILVSYFILLYLRLSDSWFRNEL